LNGHDHNYERFAPLDASGAIDLARGIRVFIVGTGGHSLNPQKTPLPNSEARSSSSHGVLKLVLGPAGFEWQFLAASGSFADSGTDLCAGTEPDGLAPTTPANLAAAPATATQVDLTWTAASDAVGVVGYDVFRNDAFIATVPPGTAYADTTASPGTSYTYEIRARDAAGNVSGRSNQATATTPTVGGQIVIRGASSAANVTATTLSIPTPLNASPGDVMVAAVSVRGNPTITAPAGWTFIRLDAITNSLRQAAFYRVVTSAEPPAHTWTFSSSQAAAGGIVAYGGVSTNNPIDAHGGQTSTATPAITAPSITTTVPNTMLLGLYCVVSAMTVAPPGGMAERWDIASNAGTFKITSEAADESQASAGATGTKVATAGVGTNPNIGQLIALRPAGA
jgi:hypothetical protein